MSLDNLIGQKQVKERILQIISEQNIQSFLITGSEGSGKKTFAFELAKGLLCSNKQNSRACGKCNDCVYFNAGTHPDFKYITKQKSDSNIKVDFLRKEVIDDIIIAPHSSLNKVYVINGDELNKEGQNALLKSMEEPPANVFFIIVSSDKNKLLPTVLSRVEEIKIGLYTDEEVGEFLRQKLMSEGIKDISEEKIEFCIAFAFGVINNAYQLYNDEIFNELRIGIIDIILDMKSSTYTEVLVTDYQFFEENKENIDKILLLMMWIIGDLGKIIGNHDAKVKNQDVRERLIAFVDANPKVTLDKISNSLDYIVKFSKNLEVNTNFECSVCNLLLGIKKELGND